MLSACVAGPGLDVGDPADLDDEGALVAAETSREAPDEDARPELPSPGAPGIGDPLFPTLGNGGYDVEHYGLRLRYETADPSQSVDGTATIRAHATQSLSQFDLDFAGDSVGAVRVDGRPAAFVRDGEELVITPARPIRRGQRFVVAVAHFVATPLPVDPADILGAPFLFTPDGSGWAPQPNNAHRIFPCNDHPGDKASFSFRIDVPEGTTAVANGVPTSVHTAYGRTVYRFEQREPMATELAQVAVGAFTVIERGRHAGVTLRDVVPTRLVADLEPKLAVVADQLDFMVNLVGDYPFPTYGSLVVDAPLDFQMETQTLSLYDNRFFMSPPTAILPIMVHELAHQWFGNSVAPERWSDVWQNEGQASWYEFSSRFGLDSPRFTSFWQTVYAFGDQFRADFGPVAQPPPPGDDVLVLFNSNVYLGGGLTLYALRQQIGDPAFRAVERAWVTTFRGRSASTEDFIALASRVSGQDLTTFLRDWLFGTTTPAMPGHPDWTVRPVQQVLAGQALGAGGPALELPPELRTQGLLRH